MKWAPFGAKITLHAGYSAETNEYGHGILGPLTDRKTLNITMAQEGDNNNKFSCPRGDHLPLGAVFEDVMPRFADVDQDGMPEIITVVSDANLGAQLRIYDIHGNQLAATPHIGTRFRWLAPIGAADLDGDGHVEIAYIDRPHLARLLRIWRYRDGRLEHVADMPGLTNHRIGEDFITGGIRDCGDGPEVLVADARWREVMAVRFDGRIQATPIGLFRNTEQVANLLACP
ncbi:FG-GAP repeat domain-containing protein [Actibacterium mucosum]|uniref:FG-GAP repeat domain-containing protein n=1 Tax=Actibacterium mucosum TaxID=1087332 RepID=UPI00055263DA|nr:VCBS repeat-containing protein [Actibacterium mucosum]